MIWRVKTVLQFCDRNLLYSLPLTYATLFYSIVHNWCKWFLLSVCLSVWLAVYLSIYLSVCHEYRAFLPSFYSCLLASSWLTLLWVKHQHIYILFRMYVLLAVRLTMFMVSWKTRSSSLDDNWSSSLFFTFLSTVLILSYLILLSRIN